MKILYAIQATGNGHISRAMELLPHLQQHGTVDIFLSGDNSNLTMDAPVKYRSKGLSLYYNCTGGLDYWQITKAFRLSRLKKEIVLVNGFLKIMQRQAAILVFILMLMIILFSRR